MTRLQLGRRVAAAVIGVLMASPLRGARAQGQVRDDRGPAADQREGGLPGPAAGRPSATIWARNEREFAQALQSGADENWVPMLEAASEGPKVRKIRVLARTISRQPMTFRTIESYRVRKSGQPEARSATGSGG